MKVLMLGWELPPHHTGGMGVVCYQMSRALAASGAQIEFVLPYTADFSHVDFMKVNPAVPDGADSVMHGSVGSTYDSAYFQYVYSGGDKRHVTMNEHQVTYSRYVSRLVSLGNYDVIHAHDWLTFRAALAAKEQSGCPLFVHVHSTEYDRSGGGSGNPLVREIEYIGLQMADKVFAVSQATKDTIIREYDIDPNKIVVVHNAMEFEDEELAERPEDTTLRYLQRIRQAGYGVVVSAGRLTIQKGLTYLLEAFAKVVHKHPKSLLLVVGSGEQYYELVERAAELGLSGKVIFTGRLNGTGRQWRDAFRAGNIFVMPSVSEPFGITPIEAIAHGTPALVSRQTGSCELLQSVLKADYWDTDEIANKIVSVLRSNDLQKTLTENGRKELVSQSWSRSATAMFGHYMTASRRGDLSRTEYANV